MSLTCAENKKEPRIEPWCTSRYTIIVIYSQDQMWSLPDCSLPVPTSVVSVANVSFKRTNLFSERSERDHLMDWFVPFSVQLSSAVIMPAGSGTHSENCEDVILVHAVIRSWFMNLLQAENWRWGRDSRSDTVLKVPLCLSLSQGRGDDSRSATVLLKLALCC